MRAICGHCKLCMHIEKEGNGYERQGFSYSALSRGNENMYREHAFPKSASKVLHLFFCIYKASCSRFMRRMLAPLATHAHLTKGFYSGKHVNAHDLNINNGIM